MAASGSTSRMARQRKVSRAKRHSSARETKTAAPTAAPDLNRLIHQRVRLGIMSALAVNNSLTFNDLKDLLEITDGNLSVHARKLEEAGYVTCVKSFVNRVPKSEYTLTDAGRRALEQYLDQMEILIRSMRGDD